MTDPSSNNFRRFLVLLGLVGALALAYMLRGVILPLFLAFLLAYVLDPFVDRLEALKIPRWAGALIVMLGITTMLTVVAIYAVPIFFDELRVVVADLPKQLEGLQSRAEPWLLTNFKLKLPHSFGELTRAYGDKLSQQTPAMLSALGTALFGTLGYIGAFFSALIVPVFALYLLIDFDRIVARARQLVPRRWVVPVTSMSAEVHRTLGGYVRGQITANIVLAALYATGLRFVDIRLAVPIGVLTGMLAFVPYVGFGFGLILALFMAVLDWKGVGPVVGVLGVMGGVQILDAMVITPRIVGKSVGLRPVEVLITMMAAGSLFGFLGVFLAVPLGAVVKIFVTRLVKVYLGSDFYRRRPKAPESETTPEPSPPNPETPPERRSKESVA
jgi:predicted PurR-regulated permease PerM